MSFTFEQSGCHCPGDNLTLVGEYKGNKSVALIEWFFDQKVSNNIIISPGNCTEFGVADFGYPSDRMTYNCDNVTNVYKATISNINGSDEGKWGVRFGFRDSKLSPYRKAPFSLCKGNFRILIGMSIKMHSNYFVLQIHCLRKPGYHETHIDDIYP